MGGTAYDRRPGRRLEGKVAIVTGAGSVGEGIGTGRATAILFAREGARVALFDRDRDSAEATREAIARDGGEAFVVPGDVASPADCEAVVRATLERYGRLDILDNNIGVVVPGSVVDVPDEAWDRVLAINLKGMIHASRFAVPAMAASGGGAIVNISSISPWRPYKVTPYSVSKGAVETLTRAMAMDHGIQGIRVNAIAPGPLFTPRAERRQTDEHRELRRKASPLEREGFGWDVGWAAVYLASDEARYVTGAVLPVDGGVSVRGHAYR